MSNDGLESTVARLRKQLLIAEVRIAGLVQELEASERRIAQEQKLTEEAQSLADSHLASAASAGDLASRLAHLQNEFNKAVARLDELASERKAMQSSRIWRWATPIRSIERWWTRRK